ncbi:MAG: CASTOR/POLLUX-related putative ion channel [Roseiflexaceae bacterium]
MSHVAWNEKVRYEIDNILAKGTVALIGILAIASLAVIIIAAMVITIFRLSPEFDFTDLVWMSLMRTLDPGTMGGDTGSWSFKFMMLAVTIGGIFIVSTLIGVLSSGLDDRLAEMRKGKSKVVERNHTVILGWGNQIYTIISELIEANANKKYACVVVMADLDAIEMQDLLNTHIIDRRTTRIVVRSGNPANSNDLQMVNLPDAKSIIVVRPETNDSDMAVIKILLAVTNSHQHQRTPYHIVAEINDPKNIAVANIISRDEIELIATGEFIARITAQTCCQSGLSVVYNDLLDFDGDEIYFKSIPSLVGKSFGQTLNAFETASVIGIVRADQSVSLNPQPSTILEVNDKLIVIANDDTSIHLASTSVIPLNNDAILKKSHRRITPEKTIILGWNWRTTLVVRDLDTYVCPGSQITIVCDRAFDAIQQWNAIASCTNTTITTINADTTDRAVLDGLQLTTYDHVVVMAMSDHLDVHSADAATLMTLLHIRDIADSTKSHFTIVSEMLDVRNRRLADATRADDFIISNRLVSLLLAQVAENKLLNSLFTSLFDPTGSEIYLKPITDYVAPGVEVNQATLIEAAQLRGEIAIGYRIHAQSFASDTNYGVVLNPPKSKRVTFARKDRIIVIADS